MVIITIYYVVTIHSILPMLPKCEWILSFDCLLGICVKNYENQFGFGHNPFDIIVGNVGPCVSGVSGPMLEGICNFCSTLMSYYYFHSAV